MMALSISSDRNRQQNVLSCEIFEEAGTPSIAYCLSVHHDDNKASGELVFDDYTYLLGFRDALNKIIERWKE